MDVVGAAAVLLVRRGVSWCPVVAESGWLCRRWLFELVLTPLVVQSSTATLVQAWGKERGIVMPGNLKKLSSTTLWISNDYLKSLMISGHKVTDFI